MSLSKEQYLLICLSEELSEMQQCISKCLRFGTNDKHPAKNTTNFEDLVTEFNDVWLMIKYLEEQGIYLDVDRKYLEHKHKRFNHFAKRALGDQPNDWFTLPPSRLEF